MNTHKIIVCVIAFLSLQSFAQKCNYAFSGKVIESSTGEPITDATVFIEEVSKGVVTDQNGIFNISNLCDGEYHVSIDHIGCDTKQLYLKLNDDKNVTISLDHFVQMLNSVHLLGRKAEKTTQSAQNISEKNIQQNAQKNLADLLEGLVGVSSLKNGSGISKPVIHGMHGNRVAILNNGVVQSGQQWGNDHSPEIDPLAANTIKVIKGVGALEYQGSTLGGLVLVKPKEIGEDPHLHGTTNTFYETNGRGFGLNVSLEKSSKLIDWRITGSLKKYGDREAPNYFLTNTGSNEQNLALQLRKRFSDKWLTKIYASTFNTELGVLRGSNVSTLSDLESAFTREIPFNTEDEFSYNINSPRQEVNHHLLKILNHYQVHENAFYEFIYAGQLNIRKEFDVRRNNLSDTPAMKLTQQTHYVELKHQEKFASSLLFKKGVQYTFTNNNNDNALTGLIPLIPDYLSHQVGLFGTLTKKKNRWMYELGARYNYTYQNVKNIVTGSDIITEFNNRYHNISTIAGVRYRTLNHLHWAFNVGWASRNPAVNELYSNGLHQGVATIERGDANLKEEKALKSTLGLEGNVAQKWFFESLVYHQYIKDYIFLNPVLSADASIRGVFAESRYEQTDAEIYGLDLATTYQFYDGLKLGAKYSYLRGNDISDDLPLVAMPANNLQMNLDVNFEEIGAFKNTYIGVDYKYTWKQTHLDFGQDRAPAPDAYQLFGLKAGTERKFQKTKLFLYVSASNLFDVSYRDFLNKLRFFSEENGRSFTVGIRAKF